MAQNESRQRVSPTLMGFKFFGANMTKTCIFALFLITLPIFIILLLTNYGGISPFSEVSNSVSPGTLNVSTEQASMLGGLLSPDFDKPSCLSRYQSFKFRKTSSFKPSNYLLTKLRKYEQLHKHCGPGTQPYNKALHQLNSSSKIDSNTTCKYIVWISYSGLGNRILTVATTFLYALLTNRVLLIDPGIDKSMSDLFCEPFPETSWYIPKDFPFREKFNGFTQNSSQSYGHLLKNNNNNLFNVSDDSVSVSVSVPVPVPPSFIYFHFVFGYTYHEDIKLFFCDDSQSFLDKVPWLFIKSDNYFVPSLFSNPSFEQELLKMFPEKMTIFHHLGRYLFHPTNQVWDLITSYYNSNLGRAEERVGIQIRTFEVDSGPFQHIQEQIQSCIAKQNLLPEMTKKDSSIAINLHSKVHDKSVAVLITSLNGGYYETLRELYLGNPSVGFYQPSHEVYQQSGKKTHNQKAWAEMYLLSLCDKLVTSGQSTFGYVAQGLGGLRPWIMYKPENKTSPDPPCVRVMSMEPCFHNPSIWDCKTKQSTSLGRLFNHVRHCEDVSWGVKVVDDDHQDLDVELIN